MRERGATLTALLKLALVFVGTVFLLSRKWNLGLVLMLASAAVGLLFAYPPLEIGRDALMASVDVLTLRLALAVVLVMTLGELLRQTASLSKMAEALQALVPNGRLVIAALPALVGLLPMVGGAMFSAPMVDEVGDRLGADGEQKTYVNYWFRHIWEPVFPLYPSLMVAAALVDLTPIQMARSTWPLVIAAAIGGLLFGLLGISRRGADDAPSSLQRRHSDGALSARRPLKGDSAASTSRAQSLRTLATSIWPILLTIGLSMALPVDERFSLIISLLVTISLMMTIKRIPPRDLAVILRERIPWKTVLVIFGALIFRRVLENSGAVLAASDAMTRSHIPVPVVAFGVPFLAGLLTGLVAAAYGISFPVVLPLVTVDGGVIAPEWAAWLLAGGLMGGMLSPVHLCLALTRVYFKAKWGPVYLRLAPSVLLVMVTAVAMLLLS
jgi:hypothetical protein